MARDQMTLRSGETHQVRLPGRGTAGFTWSFDVDGEADSIEIDVAPDTGWSDDASARVGESADEIVTIKGLRPGRAVIRLKQRRDWERNRDPINERDIEIEVA